ncbi:glycoside hydrolase family 18 [uncultured Alistipes sp.]|uniref:glycoside hydrolase family 18 n=1 Tax=uncultured Alistipes sp. TaxID=538949 RepID=UPI0028050196|nr:glycoside hydrolase family 18 [uncultured Alistipes sp.]
MNWKRNMGAILLASVFILGFTRCSKWTETENMDVFEYGNTETNKPDSYYKALREWKKTKHSVSFGWFSGWGDGGSQTFNMLAGIPDSMDIVSLWSNWSNLSEAQKRDLKQVQEQKGTRIVFCTFTRWVGQGATPAEFDESDEKRNEFWGWNKDPEEAVRKYARALVDTVRKYNYNGLDIDYEPSYYPGPLVNSEQYMTVLIEELGKYLGPKSANPDLLFILDGQSIFSNLGGYFSYIVSQAYATTGSPNDNTYNSVAYLDQILEGYIEHFNGVLTEEEVTNRLIVTENLEAADFALKGGYKFYDRNQMLLDGVPSLVGFAMWEPVNGYMKGGMGAYQFGYEATNTPSYKWMRTAIQTMNPAIN